MTFDDDDDQRLQRNGMSHISRFDVLLSAEKGKITPKGNQFADHWSSTTKFPHKYFAELIEMTFILLPRISIRNLNPISHYAGRLISPSDSFLLIIKNSLVNYDALASPQKKGVEIAYYSAFKDSLTNINSG